MTFALDEKIITKPVEVSKAMDASLISEALRTWKGSNEGEGVSNEGERKRD